MTIKNGQVGLGRLGRIHAENIVHHLPNAELYAVASVVPEELDYAKHTLGVPYTYTSYSQMINNDAL